MAWENRSGHLYYYSATRRDGRVVKTYHGKGLGGAVVASAYEEARRRRADQASALAAEKARIAPPAWAMATLDDACRLMVEASLYAGGYHKHKDSWRRRRVGLEDRGVAPATR